MRRWLNANIAEDGHCIYAKIVNYAAYAVTATTATEFLGRVMKTERKKNPMVKVVDPKDVEDWPFGFQNSDLDSGWETEQPEFAFTTDELDRMAYERQSEDYARLTIYDFTTPHERSLLGIGCMCSCNFCKGSGSNG